MLFNFIGELFGIGSKVLDKFFPDKQTQEQFKQEYMLELLQHESKIALAAAKNIQTEAASKHWLAANWRPLSMLIFVGLVVARMFGYTAEGITEAEYVELWSIVKIGIGGYTMGRTAEKITPSIIEAVKKK